MMSPPQWGAAAGTMRNMPISPARPSVDSVDRSKLPVISTKVWPTTSTPRIAAADRMLVMLVDDRKTGDCVTKNRNTATRITQIR